MKYFNRSSLAKAGKIPNLENHPSVFIDHDWVEDHNDNERRVCQVIDNDSEEILISWYTDHEDNPTYTHYRIKTCNVDLAQEMGLLLNQRSWRDKSDAILDTLYYDVNPIGIYHDNSRLRRGVWNHLKRRLKSPTMFNSQFTQQLLTNLWLHWWNYECNHDEMGFADEWNFLNLHEQRAARELFQPY